VLGFTRDVFRSGMPSDRLTDQPELATAFVLADEGLEGGAQRGHSIRLAVPGPSDRQQQDPEGHHATAGEPAGPGAHDDPGWAVPQVNVTDQLMETSDVLALQFAPDPDRLARRRFVDRVEDVDRAKSPGQRRPGTRRRRASYGIAPGDADLHVMTGKIGSTHGNSCPSHDDSRKREAAGRRDLQHYFFLSGFADGEVERRNPEGGEKLFHRILGGNDGDDRSGCFRCTPVAVENVHVSVSPSPAARAADGGDSDYFSSHFLEDGWRGV
jgi:hypothetical protein